MNAAPDLLETALLENAIDRAFTGLSAAREAFAPQLSVREVGTLVEVSTGVAIVARLAGRRL